MCRGFPREEWGEQMTPCWVAKHGHPPQRWPDLNQGLDRLQEAPLLCFHNVLKSLVWHACPSTFTVCPLEGP